MCVFALFFSALYENLKIFQQFFHSFIPYPPTVPRSTSSPLNQTNLCCPNIFACVTFLWSVIYFSGATFLEETDSPSPRSYQLSVTPQLKWSFPSIVDLIWLELAEVLCVFSQLLCICSYVNMYSFPALSRRHCLL